LNVRKSLHAFTEIIGLGVEKAWMYVTGHASTEIIDLGVEKA
jgi:hypothetical protein